MWAAEHRMWGPQRGGITEAVGEHGLDIPPRQPVLSLPFLSHIFPQSPSSPKSTNL